MTVGLFVDFPTTGPSASSLKGAVVDFGGTPSSPNTGYIIPGYTLRDGDRLLVLDEADVTALNPNTFPFYDASGNLVESALNTGGHVPFYNAVGTTDNIALVV